MHSEGFTDKTDRDLWSDRLTALTSLKLYNGSLLDVIADLQAPPNLQILQLHEVIVDGEWLGNFSTLLTGLTSLELLAADVQNVTYTSPITSLR